MIHKLIGICRVYNTNTVSCCLRAGAKYPPLLYSLVSLLPLEASVVSSRVKPAVLAKSYLTFTLDSHTQFSRNYIK